MKCRVPLAVDGVVPQDIDTWPEIDLCDARDHEARLATRRAYPVQGPIDYCDACCARLQQVYTILCVYLHVEELSLGRCVRRLRGKEIDP